VWESTKNLANLNSFKLILKQNLKKIWERRSHAFPPHYTPVYSVRRTWSRSYGMRAFLLCHNVSALWYATVP